MKPNRSSPENTKVRKERLEQFIAEHGLTEETIKTLRRKKNEKKPQYVQRILNLFHVPNDERTDLESSGNLTWMMTDAVWRAYNLQKFGLKEGMEWLGYGTIVKITPFYKIVVQCETRKWTFEPQTFRPFGSR